MAIGEGPAAIDPHQARLARAETVLRRAEQKAGVNQEARLRRHGFYPPARGGSEVLGGLGVPLSQGALVGVSGSTALLLAMVGACATGGKWVAVVGMPTLGMVAAMEYGIDLSRLVLIPTPGAHSAGAIAALIDGFDVVVVGEGAPLAAGQRRSLLGRARNQRTTLFTPLWPEVPIRLEAETVSWGGVGKGRGYLRERCIAVRRAGSAGEGLVHMTLRDGRLLSSGERLSRVG